MTTAANPRYCCVFRCKHDAEATWWTDMAGGHELPVCLYHKRRRLWWYRGLITDRDGEAE